MIYIEVIDTGNTGVVPASGFEYTTVILTWHQIITVRQVLYKFKHNYQVNYFQ